MQTGIVKKFNKEKMYGFIRTDAGQEFFFHISGCINGYDPRESDQVTFIIGQNDRTGKTQAQEVQLAA